MRRCLALTLLVVACSEPIGDCSAIAVGELAFEEALLQPKSTAEEWISLRSRAAHERSLFGATLYARGTGDERSQVLLGGTIDAGERLLLTQARKGTAAYRTPLGPAVPDGGILGLRCGTVVIDELTWSTAWPQAQSLQRLQDGGVCFIDSEVASAGSAPRPCVPPLAANQCRDDGGVRLRLPVSDLRISELMVDPAGVADALGEYVELSSNRDVDISGVTVELGQRSVVFAAETCQRLKSGTYFVIAASDAAELPRVDLVATLGLTNTKGSIILRAADGGVIDRVDYDAGRPGRSWQRGLRGELCLTPDASSYRLPSGDFGTPGSANGPCP